MVLFACIFYFMVFYCFGKRKKGKENTWRQSTMHSVASNCIEYSTNDFNKGNIVNNQKAQDATDFSSIFYFPLSSICLVSFHIRICNCVCIFQLTLCKNWNSHVEFVWVDESILMLTRCCRCVGCASGSGNVCGGGDGNGGSGGSNKNIVK